MNFYFISGLLIGCLMTLGYQFIQRKWSANAKHTLNKHNKKNECVQLFDEYPHFMSQLKTDLSDPAHRSIKEFFVVEPTALMNSSTPRLRYDLSENTVTVLKKIEQLGYISQVPNDSLLYKMSDDFVAVIKSHESNLSLGL